VSPTHVGIKRFYCNIIINKILSTEWTEIYTGTRTDGKRFQKYSDTELGRFCKYLDTELGRFRKYSDTELGRFQKYPDTELGRICKYSDTELGRFRKYSDTELDMSPPTASIHGPSCPHPSLPPSKDNHPG
jgi:hypothetical protein